MRQRGERGLLPPGHEVCPPATGRLSGTHYRQQLRQKMLRKGSPTLQPWQQARANMGGRGVEQQPWAPAQDSQRLEEDGANHPPRAFGMKASSSKGHSLDSHLRESEVC
ncbi:hypothetical protein MC885_003446 [Smutsia gigantea]|nr:hypothetical protein MC885_003446 [Smutsia gigantea]